MSYEFISTGLEAAQRKTRILNFKIVLTGSATPTLVTAFSDTTDVVPYLQINGVQPSTAGTGLLFLQDSGANFPALDSTTAPTVWGLLILCKDADKNFVPTFEFVVQPAGTVQTLTLRGVTNTGVTANLNIAASISSATTNLTAAVTYTYQIRLTYKCIQGT